MKAVTLKINSSSRSNTLCVCVLNVSVILNDGLEMMRKKAIVAYFKAFSPHFT